MSDGTFLLEAGYWLTRPLAILIGVLLITMPYFTRVRVHARMSDEAFSNVRRGALWAQTIGIGVLVLLFGFSTRETLQARLSLLKRSLAGVKLCSNDRA